MIESLKPVGSLSLTDLQDHPVWQYTNSGGMDETAVRPVKRLPVANLTGKVVGTRVLLADSDEVARGFRDDAAIRSGMMSPWERSLAGGQACGIGEAVGQWFAACRSHVLELH